MAHDIDEMAPGVHAALFARQDAWHKLGTTLPFEFTAAEAMEFAHLGGWNVRKLALPRTGWLDGEKALELEVPDRYAMVRDNPVTGAVEYLGGVVGGHYKAIQNETHADLLDTVAGESGAHFDTAGSLAGGRDVFLSMKLPEALFIGGADRVDLNLIALNNHTGNAGFRFLVSPVRVVCRNTQEAAIAGARSSFTVRHNGLAEGRMQEAREALGLTYRYVEAFKTEAELLLARDVTAKWVDAFLDKVLLIDSEMDASRTQRKHRDGMLELWRDSPTLEGIKTTRWGAYQTVTEYWDHIAPIRGTDAAAARANRTLTSHATQQSKDRAFQLARSL